CRRLAPQTKQIAVQRVRRRVRHPLAEIELAALERLTISRVVERGESLVAAERRKLRQEFGAPLAHCRGQLLLEVREVEKRFRGRELLTLKEHRRRGHE